MGQARQEIQEGRTWAAALVKQLCLHFSLEERRPETTRSERMRSTGLGAGPGLGSPASGAAAREDSLAAQGVKRSPTADTAQVPPSLASPNADEVSSASAPTGLHCLGAMGADTSPQRLSSLWPLAQAPGVGCPTRHSCPWEPEGKEKQGGEDRITALSLPWSILHLPSWQPPQEHPSLRPVHHPAPAVGAPGPLLCN